MRKAIFTILLILVTVIAAVGQSKVQPQDLSKKMDAYVDPFLRMNTFSGVILIADHSKIVFERAYGIANYEWQLPNTPKTRFHIASVSKSFTAAGVLMLQERGHLQVQDPVAKYVPDFPSGEKITIHQLLTHTSGIHNVNSVPDYADWSRLKHTTADLVAKFKDLPLDFPPGTRYSYSNSNYNLLALIIERVSGKSYADFIRENILLPLGMNASGVDSDATQLIPYRAEGYVPDGLDGVIKAPFLEWSTKTGNGSLFTTAEDLLKWDRALYTDRLLKTETRKAMFTPYADQSVGYGWFVGKRNERPVIRMNGRSPGFSAEIHRYVEQEVFIAVLSNNYSTASQEMINDIGAIYFGLPYQKSEVPDRRKVRNGELKPLEGHYRFGPEFFVPNAEYTVEDRGDHLVIKYDANNVFPLVPLKDGSFYDRTYGGLVKFELGTQPHTLQWHMQGKDFQAQAVR